MREPSDGSEIEAQRAMLIHYISQHYTQSAGAPPATTSTINKIAKRASADSQEDPRRAQATAYHTENSMLPISAHQVFSVPQGKKIGAVEQAQKHLRQRKMPMQQTESQQLLSLGP